MASKFNLSETEMEIMDMIWESNNRYTFSELLTYFNQEKEKQWKKQTLNTYLSRLIEKGVLTSEKQGNKLIYFAACTKDVHITKWTTEFLGSVFQGSLKNFMSAFTGGKTLSAKDVEDLKEFLDDEM